MRGLWAAESPRPVTYAHRTRVLRGTDPAFVGARTVGYDELAAAVDRLRTRTDLTFESRTCRLGGPAELAVLEAVAAGSSGAAIVLTPAGAEPTEALADEWVSHLLTDSAGLDTLDPAALEDLRAVVVADGPIPGGAWSQVTVVTLGELLNVG
ncbi:hypothetical protein [Nocardia brasiliensis]|uniref:hypothetical protein n=1 Tax=Nocardia brasiliensis TaxID=37326 RepID=UPI00245433F4|nr:hypothetical protein [Nocardia brasiliensis]